MNNYPIAPFGIKHLKLKDKRGGITGYVNYGPSSLDYNPTKHINWSDWDRYSVDNPLFAMKGMGNTPSK